jgi:hypothetical protein
MWEEFSDRSRGLQTVDCDGFGLGHPQKALKGVSRPVMHTSRRLEFLTSRADSVRSHTASCAVAMLAVHAKRKGI